MEPLWFGQSASKAVHCSSKSANALAATGCHNRRARNVSGGWCCICLSVFCQAFVATQVVQDYLAGWVNNNSKHELLN